MTRLSKRAYLLSKEVIDNPLVNAAVARRTLRRSELPAVGTVDRYLEYGRERTTQFTEPIQLGDCVESIRNRPASYTASKPFVFDVPDAQLVGPDGLTVTPDGEFVIENSLGWIRRISMSGASALAKGTVPMRRNCSESIDIAASLVGPWDTNYFHWFIDYIPRLEGVERYADAYGVSPTLLVPTNPPPWLLESLRLLGYADEDLAVWSGGRLNVERLVIPSLRRGTTFSDDEFGDSYYSLHPDGLEWVRSRFRDAVEMTEGHSRSDGGRLFVSRENASERRVRNEAEFHAALNERAIEPYRLEELSVANQVALFDSAKLVVGATGAGLTNLLFSEGTNVLGMFGEVAPPMYYVLAEMLGHEFACLRCRAVQNDLVVNVQDFDRVLELLERAG